MRRIALLLSVFYLLSGFLHAQTKEKIDRSLQKIIPLKTSKRLREIFEENKFTAKTFQGKWIPDGSGYIVSETSPGSGNVLKNSW